MYGIRRLDQCVRRVANAIAFEKELRADHAFRSRMKVPGLGTPSALPLAASLRIWKASIVLLPGSESKGKVIFSGRKPLENLR